MRMKLLVITLIVSLLSTAAVTFALPTASAAGSDFEYTITYDWWTEEESIEITGYSGPGGDVVIPSEINGMPVTSIADNAFNGCDTMTSVTVPDSVTLIGYGAFMMCRSLTTAVIGDGVTTLDGTFLLCTALQNVSIGSGVTTIGPNAFGYCFALSSITIPENVTAIEMFSFQYCFDLRSMYFEGNAPVLKSKWDYQRTAIPATELLTTYFYYGSLRFCTPSWNGMPSAMLFRPPSAPLELEVRSGNGSAALAWKAPARDGGSAIDHYVVYMNGTELMTTNTTKVNVTGLANEELYFFVVAAHNSAGFGENSTEELAFPRDGLTMMTLPAADLEDALEQAPAEKIDESGTALDLAGNEGSNRTIFIGGFAAITAAAALIGFATARRKK